MDSLANKLILFGEWLENFGKQTSELGIVLLPYSFFAYLIFRIVIFKTSKKNIRYNNLVKSIWYLAYGMMMLTNDVSVDLIVMLIAFIEGIDLFFKYLEDKRGKGTP